MFQPALLLPILGLVISSVTLAQAQGYYTITAPEYIKPNSEYSVHMSVSNVLENSRIKLTLKGPKFHKSTELTVPPYSEKIATFQLEDIKKGDYSLEAQGLSGVIFQNSTKLIFENNLPAVYLQTDKSFYRHGDTVQFRAIFLDQYLLPANVNQPISIVIKDGQSNTIHSFDNVTLNTGVFKGKLKLAELVVSGEWSVRVYLDKLSVANKTFEVKEYELPLFEVKLDVPIPINFKIKEFEVQVNAHYSFGKPIDGICLVQLISPSGVLFEKEFNLSYGQLLVLIRTSILGRRIEVIEVRVKVIDDVTKTERTISRFTKISTNMYEIEMPNMQRECFEENDIFIYTARISHVNGKPVDIDEEVYVKIKKQGEDETTTLYTYPDENGSVMVELECGTYSKLNVTIQYKTAEKWAEISLYYRSVSGPGGVFVKTQFPKVGSPMEVRLISPETFSSFVCVIVGRGNIIYNDIIKLPNGRSDKAYTFSITPTYEMMPEAHIFVYFFKDGKMIYYSTKFALPNQFQNSISIDMPELVKPGTFVSIIVETDPESYVGLMGVDKSVLLLKSGNDLNAEKIFENLKAEDTKIFKTYTPGELAGLSTMTNAQYNLEDPVTEGCIKTRSSRPKTRKKFHETFTFTEIMSEDGQSEIREQIPDTITTWVVTGFSINPKTGFALTTTPTEIRTFLHFFVTVKLPQSVKLGEIIDLEVTAFNYLRVNVEAKISMESEKGQFEFFSSSTDKKQTVQRFIARARSETVRFKIRPTQVGIIDLKIFAECISASDVIIKKLKVVYEGVTEWNNMDFFISGEESKTYKINIPQNIVPGSEHIEISLMDFIMGSMLNLINNGENFDNLIRAPWGCGEQNMIIMVPNLMVLKYLQSTGKTNQALRDKAIGYLKAGYQRELTYEVLREHSFSTWGSPPGITWLTAYVIRIFNEAKPFIYIDENIIKNGLEFLKGKQEYDGSFREDGSLYDFAKFNKLSVTASALLAFLENTQYKDKYKNVIDKATKYIRDNVKQNTDMRASALCLYVLQLAGDPMVEDLLATLETKAKTGNGYKWWQNTQTPANIDVYITGYIAMAMLEMKRPITPIIKWIVSKRNSNGGFASSLETEAGMRALSIYAAKYKEQGSGLDIDVHSQGQLLQSFKVGANNKNINKKIELPKELRELQFTATGNGKATFQISYNYNTLERKNEYFSINSTLLGPPGPRNNLQVCTQYIYRKADRTSMSMIEVNLPSSQEVGPECCGIKNARRAKKIVKQSKQKVEVYLEGLSTGDSECVEIPTLQQYDVDNEKPGYISTFEYYEKKSDKYFYEIL